MAMFEHRPDVPLIDRVKIQAEVLVPLIKGLEDELGKDRAHDLVRAALGDTYRDLASGLSAGLGSRGALTGIFAASSVGEAIHMEERDASAEAMEIDVTGCRYAQFFQQLGEPELGFLLVCSADFPLAEGIPGVELQRTQTIMQGAEFCDFRYRFTPHEMMPPPSA